VAYPTGIALSIFLEKEDKIDRKTRIAVWAADSCPTGITLSTIFRKGE
jgi:hypothetical protein